MIVIKAPSDCYLCQLDVLFMHVEWFTNWFDSPYYHKLYHRHNDEEAQLFIDNLIKILKPEPGAQILDLACGRGRHAFYLSKLGFDVIGLDFSMQNILHAQANENDRLSFFQHDMRAPYRTNYFQYIFNFFTSFGYFDREEEHLQTLRNVFLGLRPGGIFVLDFMNSRLARERLIADESLNAGGILFHIHRSLGEHHICKTIEFDVEDQQHVFEERVRSFEEDELRELFIASGFEQLQLFGNYQMDSFDAVKSDRLIILALKPYLPPT